MSKRVTISTFGFIRQFILSDWVERCLMTIGITCALASALGPLMVYNAFGILAEALGKFGSPPAMVKINTTICGNQSIITCKNEWNTIELNDSNSSANLDLHNHSFVVRVAIIGCAQMILFYIMVVSLTMGKERQIHRIRSQLFQSILRQDICWFDTKEGEEFPNWAIHNINKLEIALGDKIGVVIYYMTVALFSAINSFIFGWQLTLAILAVRLVTSLWFVASKSLEKNTMKAKRDANVIATRIALEAMGVIRTVQAFDGQSTEVDRYDRGLKNIMKAGIKHGLLTAGGSAIFWFFLYTVKSLAYWLGAKFISDGYNIFSDQEYSVANIIIVTGCMQAAFRYLIISLPYLETIAQAKVSASIIFNIINKKPEIDCISNDGLTPQKVIAKVKLNSVDFNYPTRPEVKVLNDFSLQIHEGETVALVGESGSGKTTVIQLLLRLYNPLKGTIHLDEHDIRTLNIGWLRTNIGVVSQEPVLFSTTIEENIRYGLKSATQEDIEKASKVANAHDFISSLPNKYDTLVGENGVQLSGGQKQRIAIARTLIANPKLLLLDEATSALDAATEARLLDLLLKAKKDQTVLMVTHRLSTITNSDRIAVMCNGRIAELGTHNELLARGGVYCNMVKKQQKCTLSSLSSEGGVLNEEYHQDPLQKGSSPNDPIQNNEATPSIRSKMSESQPPSLRQLISLCQKEWYLIGLGYLAACAVGATEPLYALLIGYTIEVFASEETDLLIKSCIFYCYMFLALGIGAAICSFLQISLLTYSGETLARRIRKTVFSTILNQGMNFFDNPNNSIGSLSNRLNGDVFNVQEAAGPKMGAILQPITAIIAGHIAVLTLCWEIGLIFLCATAVVFIFLFIQYKMGIGLAKSDSKITDNANKVAIDATSNIRTVATLHAQITFHQLFLEKLSKSHRKFLLTTNFLGFTFAFGLTASLFILSGCYVYMGSLVHNKDLGFGVAIRILLLLWNSTVFIGQIFIFLPHINNGLVSAANISKILENQSKINEIQNAGIMPVRVSSCPPRLEFNSVAFKYPFRPHAPVLQQINLKIESGQTLALIGTTGCGKTTCINLLERFYKPTRGRVTLDGMDISTLNVRWLRSQIGLLSQEPILFSRSIAENIAYGDNTRQVPMEEIVKAAIKANIHHFLVTLPQGYDTPVGAKGIKLSGGQKQRIAIARALLRDPKILLLDEPTSAMDVENEKVVQEALDRAQKGRTCIIVAHRLSTIRNVKQIAVIHRGSVVEMGTHEELMEMKGHYFKFHQTPHIPRQ